jgi:hypothetical protein
MRSCVAARCGRIVDSSWFDPLMLGIIAINAVTLGLETYASIDAAVGEQLRLANEVILGVFVVELLIRMRAYAEHPRDYFRSGWTSAVGLRPRPIRNDAEPRAAAARAAPADRARGAAAARPARAHGRRRALDPGRGQPRGDHPAARLRLLDADVLRLVRPARVVPHLQPLHRDRHQLDEQARAIELHRAERELLDEDDEDHHEKAHAVVLEERLRTLRAAVEELEREVRAKS